MSLWVAVTGEYDSTCSSVSLFKKILRFSDPSIQSVGDKKNSILFRKSLDFKTTRDVPESCYFNCVSLERERELGNVQA